MSLEVGEETKLLPDSAFGNFLCTSQNLFFPCLPCPLKLSYSPVGDPKGTLDLEKVQNYPQPVKCRATLFMANLAILLYVSKYRMHAIITRT